MVMRPAPGVCTNLKSSGVYIAAVRMRRLVKSESDISERFVVDALARLRYQKTESLRDSSHRESERNRAHERL